MDKKYDIVVLGGGAGGLTVAAGAASIGAKVALIEKEEQPGGDCLHFGCVPSKALIKAANEVFEMNETARKHGVQLAGKADWLKVRNRVQAAIDTIQVHDDADRFRKMGVDVFISKGTFLNHHEIQLEDGFIVSGKRIVIATGSRPFIPPIEGLKDTGFITNETIFKMEELPKSMLVIGGGPIGLELAQAMKRLGTEVTLIERSEYILAKEDAEVQEFAQERLQQELNILTSAFVQKVERIGDRKRASIIVNEEVHVVDVDEILVASGRTPNSDKIGLENTAVKVDEKGYIQVNQYLQTNVKSIFAIGDVNGKMMFTHVAGMEGKSTVQNAVLGIKQKVSYDNIPWVTFTSPEIFHLGLTENEAKEKHGEINVYHSSLNDVDRFVADRDGEGFVKLITDRKGKIVGAHAVGKGAGDWMQIVVYAKQKGKKIGDLSRMIYPYPNHAAAVQRTTDAYWRKKLFDGVLPKLLKHYIRFFR
ncbi:dihydrolipoyl dehydrogenase family protein [Bacillus kexueae]|uniref:dihydrolipoyl dehydrogenase family protein n=1 Tax=Aeribacillus kexueae TaxID=2078952 RepID=UPI001FAF51A6|nr:NAD(P)/FAD-dependent oxidoreductase [Bacillus kexueae]